MHPAPLHASADDVPVPQQHGRLPVALPASGRLRRDGGPPASPSPFLSQNNLKSLPDRAFANTPLNLLDLSLNPGMEMHRDSLAGLEDSLVQLLLRENNISHLNTDMSSLRSLKLVDLSTNHLTSLPAWKRELSIETLNLQNNSLVTLERGTVAALEHSLKTLYVGDNPLSCCGNLDLVRLLQHSAVVVPDIEAATCVLGEGSEPVNIEKVTREMCRGRKKAKYIVVIVGIVFLAAVALGVLVKYLLVCVLLKPPVTHGDAQQST